jgi:hypothetical protein
VSVKKPLPSSKVTGAAGDLQYIYFLSDVGIDWILPHM